jgi:hypothetical protein
VGHDDGHNGETVRAHPRARDGDVRDVSAIRREDDVVYRDEEDGVREGVFLNFTTRMCVGGGWCGCR